MRKEEKAFGGNIFKRAWEPLPGKDTYEMASITGARLGVLMIVFLIGMVLFGVIAAIFQ